MKIIASGLYNYCLDIGISQHLMIKAKPMIQFTRGDIMAIRVDVGRTTVNW